MVRWYAAYPCFGNSISKATLVARSVNELGIKDDIPLMRIEPSKSGNYYLFLAVECEGGEDDPFPVPDSLLQLEKYANLSGRIELGLDDRDNINHMSRSPVDVQEFFDRIPRVVLPIVATLPNDEDESSDSSTTGGIVFDENQVMAYDRLLAWCSAKGSGSWSQFLDACGTLGVAEGSQLARRLQKRLRLLGHIETDHRGRWSMAPPASVQFGQSQTPTGFFLCGQRTDQIITESIASVRLTRDHQPQGNTPCRISSEVSLDLVIPPPVGPINHVGNVSEALSENLKYLTEWESDLVPFPAAFQDNDFVIGGYSFKKYGLSGFQDWYGKQFEGGFYELFPLDNIGDPEDGKVTGYYNEKPGSWHRGDWYGLRFLAKVRAKDQYSYEYDLSTGTFSISEEWRWPEIYERALVLSSGLLPASMNGRLTYKQIDKIVLDTLHKKLEVA